MKKLFATLYLQLIFTVAFTQETVKPTDAITITGLVEKPLTITFPDIAKEKAVSIENFKVTNHLGEFKKEYRNIKAVPLLPFLEKVVITSSSPKVLSECYLVFRCSDGYSVV